MAIPVNIDATWLNPSSVQYNAQELRRADAAMFNGDGTAFGVSGGVVRHGDNSLMVTVNASDVITVQPGAVVIPGNSGTGNGCYRCALGAADTGTLAARNATLPRIDLVVFRVLDTDVVSGHGAYTGRVEIITGTAASSPAAPALPALAVELARISVPASGGGTATVDSGFRTYAASLGGKLFVPNANRLPAVDASFDRAVALDTGQEWIRHTAVTGTGTQWYPSTPLEKTLRRVVLNNVTWSNPTTFQPMTVAAEQTACTMSFLKALGTSRLEVDMQWNVQHDSGGGQLYLVGLRFAGPTNLDVVVTQHHTTTTAVVRLNLVGHVPVTGLAAGTYSVQPILATETAAQAKMFANYDQLSYRVREVY